MMRAFISWMIAAAVSHSSIDPSVIPINTRLDPGQSLNTSLTFVTPADPGHLFLTGDAPLPDHIPLAWRFFKIYADPQFGYEKLSHKPTVLRVL
jgi:hypothetical protein